MTTYITLSYSDISGNYCNISDYNNQCIVLSVAIPVFGCGAIYARIWHAGVRYINGTDPCYNDGPDIRLISNLGS